jgi:hypothetical protein
MVISFIFAPPDLYDLQQKNQALDKTADPDSIGERVGGELDRG